MGLVRWFAVLSLVAFIGCDGSSSSMSGKNTLRLQDEVKSVLEGVINSGEIDSGVIVARDALEKMKATDAPKAEKLLRDLAVLERLKGQAAKEKAKEMLETL